MKNIKIYQYIAAFQALIAMLGSLYFSEILHFIPCSLCWYQRICMYPLVVLISVGIIFKDKNFYKYVLPLSIIGWGISLYHNLLYFNILPETVTGKCLIGISCTFRYVTFFGFLTIPLLSFVAFTVINICMIIVFKLQKASVEQI